MVWRRIIDRFNTEESVLSQHEVAKEMRGISLDMFNYGMIGSERKAPRETNPSAIKIPELLKYSKSTTNHYNTLNGVLSGEKTLKEEEEGFGVLNQKDLIASFSFPNLTLAFENSFMAIEDNNLKGRPELSISLNNYNDGSWKVNYSYHHPSQLTIFDPNFDRERYISDRKSIGEGCNFMPERRLLVNFLFSPKRHDPNTLLECIEERPLFKEHIKFIDYEYIDGFESFRFVIDKDNLIQGTQSLAMFADKEPEALYYYTDFIVYGLMNRKNLEFSIVKLGKVQIGNQTFHIYSGSEAPLVREKTKQKGRRTFNPSLLTQKI